jgi:hypothetical protein
MNKAEAKWVGKVTINLSGFPNVNDAENYLKSLLNPNMSSITRK